MASRSTRHTVVPPKRRITEVDLFVRCRDWLRDFWFDVSVAERNIWVVCSGYVWAWVSRMRYRREGLKLLNRRR